MIFMIDKNLIYAKLLFSNLGIVYYTNGYDFSRDKLSCVDYLIVRSITKVDSNLLSNTPVKFVGTITSGIDHLDQDWLVASEIIFFNTPGFNARSVAEYVFSALFLLCKRYSFFLRDRIVGIIGLGNIGSMLNGFLRSWGVQTILCDPPLAESGVVGNWSSLEKVVSEADVLTFHVPLKKSGPHATWHMVDEDFLSSLSDNCILINTCRGSVIDNRSLLKVLQHGKKIRVVLDVWEFEPYILLPLLSCIDIGTPHIAGSSIEGKIRGAKQMFNLFINFFNVPEVHNVINIFPKITQFVRLNKALDEKTLSFLIHLVYNVAIDDILFRNFVNKVGYFEKLREMHLKRREWSSLCVYINNSLDYEILMNLGFSCC